MTLFVWPPQNINTSGIATEAKQDDAIALLTTIEENTDAVESELLNIHTDMAKEATAQKLRKWPYADYDAQVPTFNATQDVWEYKTGGTSGTVVGTITIDYTDATKSVTASVQYSPAKVV